MVYFVVVFICVNEISHTGFCIDVLRTTNKEKFIKNIDKPHKSHKEYIIKGKALNTPEVGSDAKKDKYV